MSNNSATIKKLVVFTSNPNFSVLQGTRRLLDEIDDAEVLVMIHAPPRAPSRLIKNQFRNLRRHGPAWIPYQAGEIFALLAARARRTPPCPSGQIGRRYSRDALLETGRVRFETFASINSTGAQQAVRDFAPDLGVSLAAPILKESVFGLPTLGTINLHKGKLPQYRGMPPAFWEIHNGGDSVGCTIHKIEAGLDTGAILLEDHLPIARFSTAAGLRVGLDELGNRLLVRAVTQLRDGTARFTPQSSTGGNTNSRPPLRLEWRQARDAARKEGTVSVRQSVKNAVFNAYSALRGIARLLRLSDRQPAVVVLLYHRVSDEFRDSVTIGIERFDQQIGFLKKHWQIVALRDLVNGTVQAQPRRPLLCITFDDGYKDNYDYAAPILIKHGVPATFFVSTDKISNQTFFQHDLDKLGHGLENMSWDDVREMQTEGLDFGSHTVNHANLANIPASQVEVELRDSKQAMHEQLGHSQVLFAYPFGSQTDITPAARDRVMEMDYACCCSAYGGINTGPLDLTNIKRIPVNYNISLQALRARIDGWGAAKSVSY